MKKPVVNEDELSSEESLTNLDITYNLLQKAVSQVTSDYSNTHQPMAIRNMLKDIVYNLNQATSEVSRVIRVRSMMKENCYVIVDGKLRKMKVDEIIKLVDSDSISQL